MAWRKAFAGLAATAAVAAGLTACGSSDNTEAASAPKDPAAVKGDITFLTNRTDLQTDGTWKKYVAQFNEKYPNVHVKVEGDTNYEDDVKTRMNDPHGYGDVLLIPNAVAPEQYPQYFESLGSSVQLADTYRFDAPKSVGGKQYGIALGGNANGVLYNTQVWKQAGITSLPKSPDEFLKDLQTIKAKTKAIPLYTNYKDGWPLGGQWTNLVGSVSGDPDALNAMAYNKAPWTEGTDIYAIDKLLFDSVHDGLTEPDPLTTNWEQSKGDFASGKIATMVLGSWAITQFQAAAKDAGAPASNVGFMSFPTSVDGKQYSTIAGDYFLAVNKNSDNKPAAEAWLHWLIDDSDFTNSQGMISAVKTAPLPSNLKGLQDSGVTLLELNPAKPGEESRLSDTADQSQVDIWGNLYRQKLVDVARGQADGDLESFFAQLNKEWGQAVSDLS